MIIATVTVPIVRRGTGCRETKFHPRGGVSSGAGVRGRGIWASTKGIRCVRRCPSPGPSRSLAERETRRRGMELVRGAPLSRPSPPNCGERRRAVDFGSTTDIELAPDRAPSPPAPLPRCRGRKGRIRSLFREGASHLPPPRSLRGRAGGRRTLRATPTEAHRRLPHINLPRQFRGRGPVVPAREGACAELLRRADIPAPYINLPQSFLGEVGEWCEPGGGAARANCPKRLVPPARLTGWRRRDARWGGSGPGGARRGWRQGRPWRFRGRRWACGAPPRPSRRSPRPR